MKYNQKSSQILMGVVASLLVSVVANASGVGAAQVAADKAVSATQNAMRAEVKAMKAPVAPLAAVTAGIKKEAAAHQPQIEGADAIRFVLNDIRIEGNTAVSTEKLKPIYSGKIGKEISLSEVYKIAEEMEIAYRKAGFEYSSVLLPEQKVSGGVVRLVVVEAVVGDVTFKGELRGRGDILESIKEKLLASKPLRNADLERYVLLLNDVAGVQASVTLSPSHIKNATDVTFDLKAKPFDAAIVADNSKTDSLGTYQGTAMVSLNNTMGMYEKLTLRGSSDPQFSQSLYAGGALSAVLFSEGTQATLTGLYSSTQPTTTTAQLSPTGSTKGFGFELMHPFVRTRAINFRLNAGFDYKNSETTTVSGGQATNQDFRALSLGGTFDLADAAAGVTVLNAEGEFGLNVFSATANPTLVSGVYAPGSLNGNKNFNNAYKKFNGTLTRLQSIPGVPGLSFTLSATGQYTTDPLPTSKEFSFGGREYGRGLDSSVMAGDLGWAGKMEVRYSIPVIDVLKVEPYVFGEYGQSWFTDTTIVKNNAFVAQTADDTLSGWTAGLGLKVDVAEYVSVYGEGAWVLKPSDSLKNAIGQTTGAAGSLTAAASDTTAQTAQINGTARFFFGLTARY